MVAGLESGSLDMGEVGEFNFSLLKLGKLDTSDLLGLDEIILFAFYFNNVGRYRRFFDFGANIGLHSVVAGKLGYSVEAYEPDPQHFESLKRHLLANGLDSSVRAFPDAVSAEGGTVRLVRVLDNTTSSHLEGTKKSPYGPLETVEVTSTAIASLSLDASLVKIDIEGSEAAVLSACAPAVFSSADFIVEIGTSESREQIFRHVEAIDGVQFFSQKNNWSVCQSIDDLPLHYKEGSVFISAKREMPWG